MTATLPKINKRTTVERGWAVSAHEDGSQTRARLVREVGAPEPERGDGMWNDGVTLVRYRDSYNGIDLDEHDALDDVMRRIWGDCGTFYIERGAGSEYEVADYELGDKDAMVEYVRRYLRIFHDVQHVSLRHHRDYSDWADVWVLVEDRVDPHNADAVADEAWREWNAWAKGDVYMVECQERTLHAAIEADPENPDDGWGDSEYVGTVYGDGPEDKGIVAEVLGVIDADVPDLWLIVREG